MVGRGQAPTYEVTEMQKRMRQMKAVYAKPLVIMGMASVIIGMSFILHATQAAWVDPGSPAPQDNIYQLINIGSTDQVRQGKLLLSRDYKPEETLTLSYPLEVVGQPLATGFNVSGLLTLDGNLIVDTNTLYVDSTSNLIGIGLAPDPAYKLTITGGGNGLRIGGGSGVAGPALNVSAVGNSAIYAKSLGSTATYAAIFGEGVTGDGINGINNYAGAVTTNIPAGARGANTGASPGAPGVLGTTASATGASVRGELTDLMNINGWAGYFAGRVRASSDVVGNKFIPSAFQQSVLPYITDYSLGDYAASTSPSSLAFDGSSVWVANAGSTNVSKIRASDGKKIFDVNMGFTPLDVVFDGQNVWVSYNNSGGKLAKLNPQDGSIALTIDTSPRSDLQNLLITFDGTLKYIWAASSSGNEVRRYAVDGSSLCSYGTNLSNPQGLAYDGTNIWIASRSNNTVHRIQSSCAVSNFLSGSNQVAVNAPNRLLFDNTNMWVVSDAASGTGNVTRISSSGATTSHSTAVASAFDLSFDGSFVWITHNSGTIVRMSAQTGQAVKTFDANGASANNGRGIVYDGTYMWIGYDAGTTISKYVTGTGWSQPDLAGYLFLQNVSPFITQTGSFNISGTSVIGTSLTVAGNLDATANTWNGIDATPAPGSGCLNGQFVKGFTLTGSGIVNLICRPL